MHDLRFPVVVVAVAADAYIVSLPTLCDLEESVLRVAEMKGGRKNLQWAVEEREVTLQDGQSIVQAVSHRGSNLVEVVIILASS